MASRIDLGIVSKAGLGKKTTFIRTMRRFFSLMGGARHGGARARLVAGRLPGRYHFRGQFSQVSDDQRNCPHVSWRRGRSRVQMGRGAPQPGAPCRFWAGAADQWLLRRLCLMGYRVQARRAEENFPARLARAFGDHAERWCRRRQFVRRLGGEIRPGGVIDIVGPPVGGRE